MRRGKTFPNSRSGNELLGYYSLRSAGADGEFGNEDDIYRNQATSGMPTSEFQLRRAVLSDGEAYQLAVKRLGQRAGFPSLARDRRD